MDLLERYWEKEKSKKSYDRVISSSQIFPLFLISLIEYDISILDIIVLTK